MRGIDFSEVQVTKEQFKKFLDIYPNQLEENMFMGYISLYDRKIYKSKNSKSFLENNIVCRILIEYEEKFYIMKDIYEKYKKHILKGEN